MEVLSNWLARLTVNQVLFRLGGSNPSTSTNTRLAQLIERLTSIQKVMGLNPISYSEKAGTCIGELSGFQTRVNSVVVRLHFPALKYTPIAQSVRVFD